LATFVEGAVVHDLGAGSLEHPTKLLELGAAEVVAVDRSIIKPPSKDLNIDTVESTFDDFHEPVDIAFMSWPVNWRCGLERFAQSARVVIYIGKNTDGACCGDPTLWRELAQREVLAHSPHKENTLIVYGPQRVSRPWLPEERTQLEDPEFLWSYDKLMESDPMGTKFPRCCECGGTTELLGGVGRLRKMSWGLELIPDSFQVPTCTACGETSMIPEISTVLDALLTKKAGM